MDRRLANSSDLTRVRIDATRCDGQGVCVLVAPEVFALDRYGLAYVVPGSDELLATDDDVRARALEADALCPRNAIRTELVSARVPLPDPVPLTPHEPMVASAPRLVLEEAEPESVSSWRSRGGWSSPSPQELLELVEQAGLIGHGGAGFPTADKWRRVVGADQPVVVANGSEREPGTDKDRYLLSQRPGLVLDGLRLAAHAVGARLAFICIDEDAEVAAKQMEIAVQEASDAGLLDGLETRFQRVPTRYVAGEETALLSVIEGNEPLPRLRPPYPSDVGVFGRATLVQNVETLAQIAIAAAVGASEYRSVGTGASPGTGVFTVGPFGGPFRVYERAFGYPLRDLLEEAGVLEGARAVLVGGYAGGLLRPDSLDILLTPSALRAAGASLGTKSIQVLGETQCPIGAVADIVSYFAEQSANQCAVCFRGLPDMAEILRRIESGASAADAVTDLETFMGVLSGRGVCRLPDGAARIALSLLNNFADDVTAHLAGGCPFGSS